jgi:tetratricopeptide (TPR) repeat protein
VKVAVLVAAFLVVGAAGAEGAADPEQAFRAATQRIAAGDFEGAQRAFEAVAELDPTGPWADDALAEAAGAAERRGDLDGARRLWRRVLEEHPDSRQSRRARARLGALDEAIGPGDRWLAVAEEHEAILRDSIEVNQPVAQIEALAALVAEHPDYPRANDARMWIGDAWMRMGRPDHAAAVYREAAAAARSPSDRWRSGKAFGDALALDGRLDAAEAQYRSMFGTGGDLEDRVLRDAIRDIERARIRARVTAGAWVVLAAALLLFAASAVRATRSPVAAARALARPPVEVLYFVPVALVLAGVALTGNLLVWNAVRSILIGGLVVTWVGGASLEAARRANRLDLAVTVVHVLATCLAIAAIVWLSVVHDRLIDLIAETWNRGHDYTAH